MGSKLLLLHIACLVSLPSQIYYFCFHTSFQVMVPSYNLMQSSQMHCTWSLRSTSRLEHCNYTPLPPPPPAHTSRHLTNPLDVRYSAIVWWPFCVQEQVPTILIILSYCVVGGKLSYPIFKSQQAKFDEHITAMYKASTGCSHCQAFHPAPVPWSAMPCFCLRELIVSGR